MRLSSNKTSGLRSLIICLEDAINREADIPALENLQGILPALTAENSVRKPELAAGVYPPAPSGNGIMAARALRSSAPLTGWYCEIRTKTLAGLVVGGEIPCCAWMPTTETEEVCDVIQMRELAQVI